MMNNNAERSTQASDSDDGGPPGFSDVPTPRPAYRERESSTRIKPRAYDGSGPWKEYAHYFERLGKLNGWRDDDKMELLWIHLEGTALNYVENIPEGSVTTYEELCGTLESRFGERNMAEIFKAELRRRARRPGESLPELGQDIRRLITNAYPRIRQEGLEELAVEKFREAILDPAVRLAVFQSKPQTLDEAVRAAVEAESWHISEGQHQREQVRAAGETPRTTMRTTHEPHSTHHVPRPTYHDVALEQLTAGLEQLAKTVERIQENSQKRRRPEGNARCYNCQQEGHFARNCPAKRKSHKSENEEGSH